MPDNLVRESRLLMAVDYVIKDTERKYDECLVDHFADYLATREVDTSAIFDRVKRFMDHKAFMMLNQARALKVLRSCLKSLCNQGKLKQLEVVKPYLDSMWNTLDAIIFNKDLSALTVFLSICDLLTEFEYGYLWLLFKKIDLPIKLGSYEIFDIMSLLKYYLKNCTNYHTLSKAEKLLKSLALSSFNHKLNAGPSADLLLLIQDLIKSCSMCMLAIIVDIAKNRPDIAKVLFPKADVANSIQQLFATLLRRPDSTSPTFDKAFNQISLCLALVEPPMNWRTIVERLESKKKFESIIIFLCNSQSFNQQKENLLLAFCLYPVLSTCKDQDSKQLIERLHVDKHQSDLIDSNRSQRLMTFCMSQIRILAEKRTSRPSDLVYSLMFDVLVLFIDNHFNDPRQHRNVMEACSILRALEAISCKDHPKLMLNQVHKLISSMVQHDEQTKPIVLELLKVMQIAQNSLKYGSKFDTINKTLELASQFSDHDIMNEFALFFLNEYLPLMLGDDKGFKAIDLVWNHMYYHAKDTNHRELLGNIAALLITIDLEAYEATLSQFGLVKHDDIPRIIGSLLVEKSAVFPTVERIVERLDMLGDCGTGLGSLSGGYLGRLYGKRETSSVKESLDCLMRGLLVTFRGESSELTRFRALKMINNYHDNSEELKNHLDGEPMQETNYRNNLNSLIDDIVDHDLIYDGILDCY